MVISTWNVTIQFKVFLETHNEIRSMYTGLNEIQIQLSQSVSEKNQILCFFLTRHTVSFKIIVLRKTDRSAETSASSIT